jgi:hypothetical protein
MSAWWNYLGGFEKFFWSLAIPFTVLFIIQMIMLAVGIDNGGDAEGGFGDVDGDFGEVDTDIGDVDGDFDTDIDGDTSMKIPLNFRLFTMRNLIIFGTIFSWAGIVGVKNDYSKVKTLIFAFSLAFVVVLIISTIFNLLLRATQSGTMDIRNAIGKEGDVYLTIPMKGKGEGKVQVIIQGSLRELEAVSINTEIKTGLKVKIIDVDESGRLVVESLKLIEKGEK